MKQRYIYSKAAGTYRRIFNETETTYNLFDNMGDIYIENKDNYEDDSFLLEIIPKGSLVRYRFRNVLATVDNVDIDDYYHMYHLTGDGLNLWVGPDNIEPVNY